MEKDIQEILLTEEQIKTRIAELGKELTADYAGKDPIIVGVLKGVVVFYADMIREIRTHCQMDFMWISSYAGTNSTGKMEVKRDIASDIKGRHVLILEDIYDTGNSLDFTYRHLMAREPASLKICTLLDTPQSAALIQQLLPELAQYVQQEPGSRGISVNDLQFYSNKMFDEEKLAALNEALAKLN